MQAYLLDNNIIPLINWMQSQFDKLTSFQLLWMSRIAVVKMKILPKFISFSESYCLYSSESLRYILYFIKKCVWNQGKSRVKMLILQLKPHQICQRSQEYRAAYIL